jgi:nucleotide-binding universal stress UspA family protein
VGWIAAAYIALRIAARIIAGELGARLGRVPAVEQHLYGPALLPQAGVAVGLALSASIDFPQVGATVTAVVLASIVIFELAGPPAAKRALVELGCTEQECELIEEGPVCKERIVLVPVSHHWSAEKLLHALAATDEENDCPSTFVLATVVTAARRFTPAEESLRAQRVLDDLASVAEEAGYLVRTRIAQSRAVDVAIANLAEEIEADLVVLGTPGPHRGPMTSFVRSPLHKIIDRLQAPVFIVPEGWEPREHTTFASAALEESEDETAEEDGSEARDEDDAGAQEDGGDAGVADDPDVPDDVEVE